MNTTNPELTYQLLLNSSENNVSNSKFYANTTGRMKSIIINEDKNTLNRLFMDINATSNNIQYNSNYYGIADTIGILITSSENTLENTNLTVSYSVSNGTLGTITGVSIQSQDTTNSNKISNITVNVNGDQYAYGLNILNSHNNTLNNTNNRYNTFNVKCDKQFSSPL